MEDYSRANWSAEPASAGYIGYPRFAKTCTSWEFHLAMSPDNGQVEPDPSPRSTMIRRHTSSRTCQNRLVKMDRGVGQVAHSAVDRRWAKLTNSSAWASPATTRPRSPERGG